MFGWIDDSIPKFTFCSRFRLRFPHDCKEEHPERKKVEVENLGEGEKEFVRVEEKEKKAKNKQRNKVKKKNSPHGLLGFMQIEMSAWTFV